jgi:GNAT superfamily N-acetyltransferase
VSVVFPDGLTTEPLGAGHKKARAAFDCGVDEVNNWLRAQAWQSQQKNLSSTTVLVDEGGVIAGFYTVAIGLVDFSLLSDQLAKGLPKRHLPVMTFAWLGVDKNFQGQALGERLLAHALLRCQRAAELAGFIGVVVDCLNEGAKRLYQRFDFDQFPGHPMKLFLPKALLDKLASG